MSFGGTHPGVLHHYSRRLVAFEHRPNPLKPASQNILLFIGGLCDGLLTVPFVPSLAKRLPENYTLVETLLSSSYLGFGSSNLGQDVSELAECIAYFRNQRPGGKIVLMGHSTGSQDVIHYLLSRGERPKIDGGIMQSGVSDREAMGMFMEPELLYQSVEVAQQYMKDGRETDVIPDRFTNGIFPAPISAKRWLSLASPAPDHAGEDDYFSSDFDDERLDKTFGNLGGAQTPVCVLYGEKDPFVPESVNREDLVERWHKHIRNGGGIVGEGSGVVSGMSHSVKELGAPLEEMISRVGKFLAGVEQASAAEESKF